MLVFAYYQNRDDFEAHIPAMIREVAAADLTPGLPLKENIEANGFWDQLACCSSPMDRSSYEGCYLVVEEAGVLHHFRLHDTADGGASLEAFAPCAHCGQLPPEPPRPVAAWGDPRTLRGKIELTIEPIIGGGATEDGIAAVVDALLALVPAA